MLRCVAGMDHWLWTVYWWYLICDTSRKQHRCSWPLTPSFCDLFQRSPIAFVLSLRFVIIEVQSIAVSMCVCLSVCPFAYLRIIHPDFTIVFYVPGYMLPVVSCNGNAVHHVLPVLWMTSCFHIVERVGQKQRWCVCFAEFTCWCYQSTLFHQVHQRAALGLPFPTHLIYLQ